MDYKERYEQALERARALYDKPAWSEEDENLIDNTVSWLDTLCDYLRDSSSECIPDVKDVINRLKSLKQRHTWQASGEQMHMLKRMITALPLGEVHNGLESLYNDLKKLKGE